MKEWKVRQEVHRRLNNPTTDNLNEIDMVWRPDTIVEDALRHWEEEVDEWIYPGKSYFVAICYAYWISEDFDEDFDEVLDDPDLLPGDPYFLPYSQAADTYDEILSAVRYIENGAMVSEVRNYYDEEMQV